ncbi:moaC [Symbiodinium microadriaticum]|nr:moaC [Symbiodinium microadriaticum]
MAMALPRTRAKNGRVLLRSFSSAADLLTQAQQRRSSLVSSLVPPRRPSEESPRGPRLRFGRGALGSAARAAAERREIEEAEVRLSIQRSIGKAPIGLYPVYDIPRQVATEFTGTKVLQPASLQHSLAEAARNVKWSASDGAALVRGDMAEQIEGQDEEEWEEDDEEEADRPVE